MDNKKKKVSFLLVLTMLFTLIPAMSCFAIANASASGSLTQTTGSVNTDSLVVSPTISTNVTPTVKVTPALIPTPTPADFGIVIMKGFLTSGTTVTVPINVKNLPDEHLAALNFTVKYDSTQLSFLGTSNGSVVPKGETVYVNGNTAGTLVVLYSDESGNNTGCISSSGTIVNLKFALSSNTTPSVLTTITAEDVSALTGDVDSSGNNIEISKIAVTNINVPIVVPIPAITISPNSVVVYPESTVTSTITAPNKATNPAVGVYNGTYKLVPGTDETLISTSTGYILTIYKSYLSKLSNINTTITIKFRDGFSLNLSANKIYRIISPTTASYNKNTPANIVATITASNKDDNPIVGVYNGNNKLVEGTDEAVAVTNTGYNLTLYKSYLYKLTVGPNTITVKFCDGSSLNLSVIVINSMISPATTTYNKNAPTDITATITAPSKATNPAIGIYNGAYKLVSKTDEVLTSTSTGYILTLYKSYISGLISINTTITIKFCDGSSLNLSIFRINPTISPTTTSFSQIYQNNVRVTINDIDKINNPLIEIYNGTTKLIEGTDEELTSTTTGYTLTLYKSYLYKLPSGDYTITFKFKNGDTVNLFLRVGICPDYPISLYPSSATYDKNAPADIKLAVTDFDKTRNPIIGVYNGTARLVEGADESMSDTNIGYTVTLNKTYLSKLPAGTYTIRFKYLSGDYLDMNLQLNVK